LKNMPTRTAVGMAPGVVPADPIDLPVIEVAFRSGRETQTVETWDGDFNLPTCSASGSMNTSTSDRA
jgi:hypothetical protein